MNDTIKLSEPTFSYSKHPIHGRYLVSRCDLGIDNVGYVFRESPTKWTAYTNDSPTHVGIYETLKAAVRAIQDHVQKKDKQP
jgi:hypothetical protein